MINHQHNVQGSTQSHSQPRNRSQGPVIQNSPGNTNAQMTKGQGLRMSVNKNPDQNNQFAIGSNNNNNRNSGVKIGRGLG